jgi:CheY-like chemotaxis protein
MTATDSSTGAAPLRILIAEDEALIRTDLAEMLAEQGYEVVGQASDGQQAVALAEQLRPDLAIFDVKMPVMDGLAAAEADRQPAHLPGHHAHRLQPEGARRAGP